MMQLCSTFGRIEVQEEALGAGGEEEDVNSILLCESQARGKDIERGHQAARPDLAELLGLAARVISLKIS
jgi:hypothetical protein